MYQTSVIQGKGIAWLLLEHFVEVGHGLLVFLLLIVHYRPVEVCECIRGIEAYGLVHVCYGLIVFLLRGIESASADIAFRVESI